MSVEPGLQVTGKRMPGSSGLVRCLWRGLKAKNGRIGGRF